MVKNLQGANVLIFSVIQLPYTRIALYELSGHAPATEHQHRAELVLCAGLGVDGMHMRLSNTVLVREDVWLVNSIPISIIEEVSAVMVRWCVLTR